VLLLWNFWLQDPFHLFIHRFSNANSSFNSLIRLCICRYHTVKVCKLIPWQYVYMQLHLKSDATLSCVVVTATTAVAVRLDKHYPCSRAVLKRTFSYIFHISVIFRANSSNHCWNIVLWYFQNRDRWGKQSHVNLVKPVGSSGIPECTVIIDLSQSIAKLKLNLN